MRRFATLVLLAFAVLSLSVDLTEIRPKYHAARLGEASGGTAEEGIALEVIKLTEAKRGFVFDAQTMGRRTIHRLGHPFPKTRQRLRTLRSNPRRLPSHRLRPTSCSRAALTLPPVPNDCFRPRKRSPMFGGTRRAADAAGLARRQAHPRTLCCSGEKHRIKPANHEFGAR